MDPPPDIRDRDNGMFKDDLAWDRSEEGYQLLSERLAVCGMKQRIIDFVVKHRGGRFVEWDRPQFGGYNCCLRIGFEDGWAAMRVPIPRRVAFVEEKMRAEVNIMRYVAENTTIPVPRIYHWGAASKNPTGLGPFIIMDYIRGAENMAVALKDPLVDSSEPYVLDQSLPDERVQELYGQMAGILLQLDALAMPRAGSPGDPKIDSRPVTQNMTDVVIMGGCPESVLPPRERTYSTSQQFYSSLADMHMAQFVFQHNDAVESADDARDKFVARHLFRRLADQGQLTKALGFQNSPEQQESFKLVCDDLTPSNVLVDKDGKVVAVIDWEFAYYGPSSIASSPPWWLLLQKPEYWPKGNLDNWTQCYTKSLAIFLKALEAEEEKRKAPVEGGTSLEKDFRNLSLWGGKEEPLSARMRKSWETGAFWINWAARSTYGFDPVFWKHIDEHFFGENKRGGYEDRIALLSDREKAIMEWVVKNKLGEKMDRKLLKWSGEGSRRYLHAVMGRSRVL